MKTRLLLTLIILIGSSVILLAACAPELSNAAVPASGSGTASGSTPPVITFGTASASTPFVITSGPASTSLPFDVTSQPLPTQAPGGEIVITADSSGQTIHLKVGQTFLVNLGMDILNWQVEIADPSIVSRVIGITTVRGAQGVYQARAPGTTTLTATGDPLCRQSVPACEMPSRIITVTLVVEP